jgi:hypothetical protein
LGNFGAAAVGEEKTNVVYASRRLVWTSITATLTGFSPSYATPTSYFLPLLLVVHFLHFLPLVESTEAKPLTISIPQLYAINGTLSFILHLGNYVWLFQRGELGSLWEVIWEHPAMSSVGWDVIFCAIIGVIGTRRIMSITVPPVISVGGTMAGYIPYLPHTTKIDLFETNVKLRSPIPRLLYMLVYASPQYR